MARGPDPVWLGTDADRLLMRHSTREAQEFDFRPLFCFFRSPTLFPLFTIITWKTAAAAPTPTRAPAPRSRCPRPVTTTQGNKRHIEDEGADIYWTGPGSVVSITHGRASSRPSAAARRGSATMRPNLPDELGDPSFSRSHFCLLICLNFLFYLFILLEFRDQLPGGRVRPMLPGSATSAAAVPQTAPCAFHGSA